MRKNRPDKFVIYIRVREEDISKPVEVWSSFVIWRRGKEVFPLDPEEGTIILRIGWETIPSLHIPLIYKCWQEGFFDEGNTDNPWFPIMSQVIIEHMYIDSTGLHFISGHEPDFENPTESFLYAMLNYLNSKVGGEQVELVSEASKLEIWELQKTIENKL